MVSHGFSGLVFEFETVPKQEKNQELSTDLGMKANHLYSIRGKPNS